MVGKKKKQLNLYNSPSFGGFPTLCGDSSKQAFCHRDSIGYAWWAKYFL